MKRIIVIVLIILCGCEGDVEPAEVETHIELFPHNSLGEFYTGIPIRMTFAAPQHEYVQEITWDYGDNAPPKASHLEHVYVSPSTYTISVNAKTNLRSYKQDTTVTVVRGPQIYGSPNTSERALRSYKNSGEDKLKILYEANSGSSANSYYLLSLSADMVPDPVPINLKFDWYPQLGPSAYAHDGTLAIIVGTELVVYSPEGEKIKTHHLEKFPRDMAIVDNNAVLVFDSTDYAVINSINLVQGTVTRSKHFIGVEGMLIHNLFLTGESSLVGHFRNKTNDVNLLMGMDFSGKITFSNYFKKVSSVRSITKISTGIVVISAIDSARQWQLMKLNSANKMQWIKLLPYNESGYYGDVVGKAMVIKELGGFIYLFFDNMRCVKLNQDGAVIWDRYYYPKITMLNGVEITSDGDFIMIGTRQFDPTTDETAPDHSKTDLVFIRITPDGQRVSN